MRHLAPVVLLLALSCGTAPADETAEWRRVLSTKKSAAAPNATARDKQVYADSLAAFVSKNPHHGRAREVYQQIQLDFAHELATLGRYQDAIRFYRAVLAHDPANAAAQEGLRSAVDHLSVSRQKLLALEQGMSKHDVAKLLGKPIPGWTVKNDDRDVESWYYRKTDGAIAGVYFRDGKLFAAEENSSAKLAPLVAR